MEEQIIIYKIHRFLVRNSHMCYALDLNVLRVNCKIVHTFKRFSFRPVLHLKKCTIRTGIQLSVDSKLMFFEKKKAIVYYCQTLSANVLHLLLIWHLFVEVLCAYVIRMRHDNKTSSSQIPTLYCLKELFPHTVIFSKVLL